MLFQEKSSIIYHKLIGLILSLNDENIDGLPIHKTICHNIFHRGLILVVVEISQILYIYSEKLTCLKLMKHDIKYLYVKQQNSLGQIYSSSGITDNC